MTDERSIPPMPEGARDGATEAWVATPGWSVELLTPSGDFIALPVTAVRIVAAMGGAALMVDDVQVSTDAGTQVLDMDRSRLHRALRPRVTTKVKGPRCVAGG
jgi:hypothetical protein